MLRIQTTSFAAGRHFSADFAGTKIQSPSVEDFDAPLSVSDRTEGNFVEGSMIAQAQNCIFTYFFTGTLNLVLISIVTASIGYSVWLEQRNLKKEVLE